MSIVFSIPVLFFILIVTSRITHGLFCFECQSMNGTNPQCEDPVDASVMNIKNGSITSHCRQARRGHSGLFVAPYCSKIKGRSFAGTMITIRKCSAEKLADIPTHCGSFKINNDLYTGCLATCTKDWCNKSSSSGTNNWIIASIAFLKMFWLQNTFP